VAISQLTSHAAQQARLRASLASGQYSRLEGPITDLDEVNAQRGLVIFEVKDQRFWVPHGLPANCWPQRGDAVRVSFVPGNDNSSFRGVGNSILTIEMTRGCSKR
jgi:hypothetical protein